MEPSISSWDLVRLLESLVDHTGTPIATTGPSESSTLFVNKYQYKHEFHQKYIPRLCLYAQDQQVYAIQRRNHQ
jgi:hypothetical protein